MSPGVIYTIHHHPTDIVSETSPTQAELRGKEDKRSKVRLCGLGEGQRARASAKDFEQNQRECPREEKEQCTCVDGGQKARVTVSHFGGNQRESPHEL